MPQPTTRHTLRVAGRQLHYRHCGSGPAVLLLHASPRSSASLLPFMQAAPPGLALFALDTPGFGLSQPLSRSFARPQPGIEDFAEALRDTLDALGIAQAAVYGSHTGAAIALALAVLHPQRVSSLVLDGVSSFTATELAQCLPAYLPPLQPHSDGSHMAWLWSRVRDQALFFPWHQACTAARLWRPLPDAAALHAAALDLLVAGDYTGAYAAAMRCDGAAWVARLQRPALVSVRADDVLAPHLARLGPPPPGVCIQSLPADRPAADARLWAALRAGCPQQAAPLPAGPALPNAEVGDVFTRDGLHGRGAAGGAGRPLVLLHPSPGGPRSLEDLLQSHAGQRPVLAPSLPGHADSVSPSGAEPAAGDEALEQMLLALGLGDAEIIGYGLTAPLAAALLGRRQRPPIVHRPAVLPAAISAQSIPGPWAPRDDGGHLFAAWQHARDEALLGPWWARPQRHAFGEAIDLWAVQRHVVEVLKESSTAAAWRADLVAQARRPAEILAPGRSAVKPLPPLD